ncbi:VOC family protein [Cryobacterium frigoriphilum]|uniref:VOC family protein n=1 Tax=Cryobacterium frigoriphilum TaxID=1259150 RepID=A0A4R9A5S9_9MICO|nr:VOC family protein [Cryobacterium frigoriphilum]TFD52175.1 VOC family protein [Cryobacterium frigoriphilum]
MTDTATDAYSSFSVFDLEQTRTFYHEVLGLKVEDRNGMLTIHLPGGASTVAYASRNHQPARFTILNIVVPDLPSTVSDLARRGLEFERYEGTPAQTDSDGIYRANGPWFAWFTDPSGNVLALCERDLRTTDNN